jgi:hypothetical protein
MKIEVTKALLERLIGYTEVCTDQALSRPDAIRAMKDAEILKAKLKVILQRNPPSKQT